MREFKIELKFIKSDSNTKEVCYTQNKINFSYHKGRKCGYNGSSKSLLIIISKYLANKANNVFGTSVNITVEQKRDLGAAIGSQGYKDKYCREIVSVWKN